MGNKSSKKDTAPAEHGKKGKKKGQKMERAFSDSDIPSMRGNPNQQQQQSKQRPVSHVHYTGLNELQQSRSYLAYY